MNKIHKTNTPNRMLAKARTKYGKPTYPNRNKKAIAPVNVNQPKQTSSTAELLAVWERMLHKLETIVTPIAFETWIQPCEPIMLTENKLVLAVENGLFEAILKKRYINTIESCANTVLNQQNKVDIIISK